MCRIKTCNWLITKNYCVYIKIVLKIKINTNKILKKVFQYTKSHNTHDKSMVSMCIYGIKDI